MKVVPQVSMKAQPSLRTPVSVALVMELLWVLKASLGFPLRRPEEMSVAGRVSEVHSSLGCAGSAQPGAWQLPGSWGLNEKLNRPPYVLDTWGTSSIPDIPILLSTWHRGPGALPPEEEAGQGLAGLLCPWGGGKGREDTALHLTLQPLGGYADLVSSRCQGKGRKKLEPKCV